MRHSRRRRPLHRLSRKLKKHIIIRLLPQQKQRHTSASNSSRTLLTPVPLTTPTTIFVTKLSTNTRIPSSLAATTSGTVLIPTTQAPAPASSAASPRVSYVGPLTHAYVPSASAVRGKSRACAARNAASRSERVYASESGTKRREVGRESAPRRGLSPVRSGSAMWSSMTTTGDVAR